MRIVFLDKEDFRMCIYPFLRELYHEAYKDGKSGKGEYSICKTEKYWVKIKKVVKKVVKQMEKDNHKNYNLLNEYAKVHKLGLCGAVCWAVRGGRVCAECGKFFPDSKRGKHEKTMFFHCEYWQYVDMDGKPLSKIIKVTAKNKMKKQSSRMVY